MAEGLKVCTQCGFTWSEVQARGLLGCPHCYDLFAAELEILFSRAEGNPTLFSAAPVALGIRPQEDEGSQGRAPEEEAGEAGGGPGQKRTGAEANQALPDRPEDLARLREQLQDAVRREHYEEAHRLKQLLRRREGQGPG